MYRPAVDREAVEKFSLKTSGAQGPENGATTKLMLFQPPDQICNGTERFKPSPYGALIRLHFRCATGRLEGSYNLLDSGNQVAQHLADNTLINAAFAAITQTKVVEVQGLSERVIVGSSNAKPCVEPLRYCFINPLFEGWAINEDGTNGDWIGPEQEFTVPGGSYCGTKLERGVTALCVSWMHHDDSACVGDMGMDRMEYRMGGDGASYIVKLQNPKGEIKHLRILRQPRTVLNPLYS